MRVCLFVRLSVCHAHGIVLKIKMTEIFIMQSRNSNGITSMEVSGTDIMGKIGDFRQMEMETVQGRGVVTVKH